MITTILFFTLLFLVLIPIWISGEYRYDKDYLIWISWIVWSILVIISIITIFTGFPFKNNEGQYKGYVTAVEQNGAIFKGWNVYLKTDLTSSNEDKACIDRDNQELINKLKEKQESKENITLEYEGTYQYPIGVCPGADWMIINIK